METKIKLFKYILFVKLYILYTCNHKLVTMTDISLNLEKHDCLLCNFNLMTETS